MDAILSGIQFLQKGGFVIYILLWIPFFVLDIGVERWFCFSERDMGRKSSREFYTALENADFDGASEILSKAAGAGGYSSHSYQETSFQQGGS